MRKFSRLIPLAVSVALLASTTSLYADKAADLAAVLSKFNEQRRFNGSALVAEHGKVILAKGYGKANFEWNIPNTPDTKFRLGSITKQFTSMVIMQLVQEGKIELDAPMSRYLPQYRKDTGDRITIRNLLTHTSGIPNYTALPGFMTDVSRDPYTTVDFIQKYASGDLEFEPGTKFNYSNSGYFLLGAIIEELTGKTYEQNVQERIFGLLGMTSSGYDHSDKIILHRASGYGKTPSGYTNAPYMDMSIPFAAAGL
ncbi:MAG: serine hydrolase domain-containing protein [Acidobacteriota bacterium]